METILVTYDLADAEIRRDITDVLSTFGQAVRLTECSFAMSTEVSVSAIFEVLSRYIDSTDKLYVIKLSEPYEGQGPEEVGNWFSNHFSG